MRRYLQIFGFGQGGLSDQFFDDSGLVVPHRVPLRGLLDRGLYFDEKKVRKDSFSAEGAEEERYDGLRDQEAGDQHRDRDGLTKGCLRTNNAILEPFSGDLLVWAGDGSRQREPVFWSI